jgi:hypothetical protein
MLSTTKNPPAGRERIVITGSSADQAAWFLNDGEISFSWFFWRSIYSQAELFTAFHAAKTAMTGFQTPQIDADSDGTPDGGGGRSVREDPIIIGLGRVAASVPPDIGEVKCEPNVLNDPSQSVVISAGTITDNGVGINTVQAIIISPASAYDSPTNPVLIAPQTNLRDNGSGIYKGTNTEFIYVGNYTISVQATDRSGLQSLPQAAAVVQHSGIVIAAGDLNLDGKIDLTDALNALKVSQGGYVFGLFPGLEINKDRKIGPEEAIYALRKLAEM